jgi:circadian clock protein KaiC
LPKCPTGIQGLDEITGGGLPRGRPTLVCGGAGCGKTLLAVEFLVRGALYGTNEFPFLIGEEGISVLPITSLALNHKISSERIATGIARLDAMLGGRGFFRGSSILLTGTPGTGKTIVAANFAQAAARRGERVLFFSFEESPNQIIRNMHSIGLRLQPLVQRGLLRFHAARPSLYGLEMHLATMFKEIAVFQPAVVIVDPITSLTDAGTESETKGMVTRLIDYLKARQVTSLFASLTQGGHVLQQSEATISSLMDAWLLLQDFEGNGERNRVLYVLKARGMAHSNQVREFLISNRGIDLVDAYIGPSGVLTGASRVARAAREKAEALAGQQEAARRKRSLERKRATLEQQIAGLRSDYETEKAELRRLDEQVGQQTHVLAAERTELVRLRHVDPSVTASARGNSTPTHRK